MSDTILMVEDHEGVRRILRDFLELAFPQYRLLEASSGEEGVTLAQASSPRMVIMDIGLPGISGIEATRRIKTALPDTVVVVLSIYDDDANRAAAGAAGATVYVPKRSLGTELLPVLTELLQGILVGEK